MSLPNIILMQLDVTGNMTGYDVTTTFKGNAGLCWIASHQQVYRELAKLEDAGLCYHTVEPQFGKPDRKVFTITEKGKERIKEWRSKKPRAQSYRDELASKVYSSKGTNHKDVLKTLEEELRLVQQEIKVIQKYEPQDAIDQLMVDRRLGHLNWRKEWAYNAINVLEKE